MKKAVIVSIFLCIGLMKKSFSQKQSHFAEYTIVGSSFTYVPTEYDKIPYNEYTWNINAGINLSNRFFFGLQLLNVYLTRESFPTETFNIYGAFTQFNFLKSKRNRFFAELSLNRGDYCTCNKFFKVDYDLYYAGVGLGFDFAVKKIKGLYLDFSFINYSMINKPKTGHGYTQYVIGLNYRVYRSKY